MKEKPVSVLETNPICRGEDRGGHPPVITGKGGKSHSGRHQIQTWVCHVCRRTFYDTPNAWWKNKVAEKP